MAPALSAKERTEKTFAELESFQNLLAAFTSEWNDLDAFIAEVDKSVALKHEELLAKEKAFEEKNMKAFEELDKREEAIPVREKSLLAKLQHQKDAAIAKYGDGPSADKQEAMDVDVQASDDEDSDAEMKERKDTHAAGSKVKKEASSAHPEVRVRPQILSLCEKMDGEGLRKFIVDHRKEIAALRNEVTAALHSAIDPSRLVLKALEGYHVLELDSNHAKETGASTNRRACILLLECLAEVLRDGEENPIVPPNIKEAAKEVAKLWRSKRDATLSSSSDAGSENSLDAQAFLQLLMTFGVASEFDEDELLKLVYAVCRRRQTPALCQSLGLQHKMSEFVETLNKDGKQIEALGFAHHFGLMEKIQPAAMLKAYLKEVRRVAQEMPKNGANPKHESMMKELAAVKAVIRVVEEYNLGDQFSTDGLQKRLVQLEKSKADRRKPAVMGKGQAQFKKPRLSGGGQGGGSHLHAGPVERGQYGGANTTSYTLSGQAVYDRRSQGAYSSVYGADARSPGSISNSYLYASDVLSGSAYPAAASSYSGLSGGYSGYPYGHGLVNQSSYPSTYLR
ncbi:hypothetical protein GOP47_0019511 [Adiantum capillus-veneris]|uniref:FRIGIDA-like protein n=1 Tax=Adiantum capillus-veneris TaxID=13818 RepID=A0A9D4UCX9_ADICA|nr:hypothetical protein GOP47_0019511 [Adiantum capillus-veneris]